ncbi:MAG: hypothetical protein E6902_00105 [Paeniclostridium sordellii]|uniref:Uncharacterized protein n=1 Tax=Paeniclostridium hominis TaxID=2764329 RepID=A0ABR7K2F3_9FIRM|nr:MULTISPECIES: hypothetical protein [Paeniclostridium]MBC6003273.1 hypothetical protein [Paeniclostridium hominis]MDU1537994.1 hypothetical protein [Paeniclostridium sordellii]
MNIELFLQLSCGIFWIMTYIIIIYKSFKDKTCGMPLFALALNLAWEFTFSFIYPPENLLMARIMFILWLILDLIILYTFFKYGYENLKYKNLITKKELNIFAILDILFLIIFIILFVNDISILYENSIVQASGFIANLQNLIMSILFVNMILNRGNTLGQSIFIAIFKWIGTLAIAILKFSNMLPSTNTELLIIMLIQVFDIIYIHLTYKISNRKCN